MLGKSVVTWPWHSRIVDPVDRQWGNLLAVAYGLWIARVSAASVVIGAVLFYYARPAQDLFLEVGDSPLASLEYWGTFYLVVLLFWVFPVYLSARWILTRVGDVRRRRPELTEVEDRVRRTIPALLAAGCLGAVLIGQVLAVINAPILIDIGIEEGSKAILTAEIKTACPNHSGPIERVIERVIQEMRDGECPITLDLVSAGLRAFALLVAIKLGSDNVILVIYGICAGVLFWAFLRRRLVVVSRKSLLSAEAIVWWIISIFVIVPAILLPWVIVPISLWQPSLPFFQSASEVFGVVFAISAVIGTLLWWRRAEAVLWWAFTGAIVAPISLITFLVAVMFVASQLEQPYGLWHLAVLLPVSAVVGILIWWGLGPGLDGKATRVGHFLMWIRGKNGPVDEATATAQLVNPIFATLALAAIGVLIFLMLFVRPVEATDKVALFTRALLIPILLGMLVPPVTVLSSWSLRTRAPLILGAVVLIAIGSQLLGSPHKIRVTHTDAKLQTLDQSLERWATANGCDLTAPDATALACPAPIIMTAAGGASRAAFHVAGLMGTLMDDFRPPIVLSTGAVSVRHIAISPDSRRILISFSDRTAQLWDSESGTRIAVMPHEGSIISASFGAGGRRIVTSSVERTARIWDGERGSLIATLTHDSRVEGAIFSRDGRRILTRSGKIARLWDGESGTHIADLKHEDVVYDANFSRDGRRIVTRSSDKSARLWDGERGSSISTLTHDASVTFANFSADGRRILTRSGKIARLWDGESGVHIFDLTPDDGVISARFSADSRRILTLSGKLTVGLWNGESGRQIVVLTHTAAVKGAIFSPDGRRVVTWSDRLVRLWDAESRTEIGSPLTLGDTVNQLVFSPDGRRIVASSSDKTARLLNGESGTEITRLGHNGAVNAAVFSWDGSRILTRSADRTAQLWDSESGSKINVLRHEADVNFSVFSPDNSRIVTHSADRIVRLWNGVSGAPIQLGPTRELRPFGKQLFAISGVSGGALGAVTFYAALADSQLARAGDTATSVGLRPPCRASTGASELFVSRDKDHLPKPHEKWKDCLQFILAGDFLSPVILSMISGDLLGVQAEDRAVVLEKAWEARYLATTRNRREGMISTGSDAGGPQADSTFDHPMLSIREKVLKADPKGWLPILLLNGTSVQTGRRIIASDVDTRGLFRDAYDLRESFGDRPGKKEPESEKRQRWDVRLSTAATISARFPGISPHGDIVRRVDETVVDRVVDGGYYEGFGASTALELVEELEKLNRIKKYNLKPFVILVNNEPSIHNLDCADAKRGALTPPKPDPWATFATLRSPFEAVLESRSARGTHSAAQLCNFVTETRFAFITVSQQIRLTKKEVSMSWWLSKYVQRYLDGELIKTNARALEKIMAAR